MKAKNWWRKIYLTCIALAVPCLLFAQSDQCGDDPFDPTSGCDIETPLDTWVLVLVIAGLCYGAWYLHKNKKSLLTN